MTIGERLCAHRIMIHHARQIGRPGMTVEIGESNLAKQSSTAVATSKESGFLVASAAKQKPVSLFR